MLDPLSQSEGAPADFRYRCAQVSPASTHSRSTSGYSARTRARVAPARTKHTPSPGSPPQNQAAPRVGPSPPTHTPCFTKRAIAPSDLRMLRSADYITYTCFLPEAGGKPFYQQKAPKESHPSPPSGRTSLRRRLSLPLPIGSHKGTALKSIGPPRLVPGVDITSH